MKKLSKLQPFEFDLHHLPGLDILDHRNATAYVDRELDELIAVIPLTPDQTHVTSLDLCPSEAEDVLHRHRST